MTMLKTLTESAEKGVVSHPAMKMLDGLQSETAWFQPFHHQLVGLARKSFVTASSSKWIWLQQFQAVPCVGGHSLLKNYFDKSVSLTLKRHDATCTIGNFFTFPVNLGLAWLVAVAVTCCFHISHTSKLSAVCNSLPMSSSKPREAV